MAKDLGAVATGVLTFNLIPVVLLFDSGATHLFISSKVTIQIGLELHEHPVELSMKLPAGKPVNVVLCTRIDQLL